MDAVTDEGRLISHATVAGVKVEKDTTAADSLSNAAGQLGSIYDTQRLDPMATGGLKISNANLTNNNNNTLVNNNDNNSSGVVTKQCAGCGLKIIDRFLLHALERYWHTGCLKCSCCQAHLGEIGTSCFTKAGMILCKNDYIRMFGSSGTCAACGQPIPASEFVMRAQGNVYHLNCFTCVSCRNRLVPGDKYGVINGSLICEQDYPKLVRAHTQVSVRPSHRVC